MIATDKLSFAQAMDKGKRDLNLNVSSLWQNDEGEMTRTILVPRSKIKMNSIGQSQSLTTTIMDHGPACMYM